MDKTLRLWAIFIVTVKRMAAQRGLAIATLLGIVAAISLTMSIPIYADAAYQKIYNTEVKEAATSGVIIADHPPYAFMFRYVGAWSGLITYDQIAAADSYFSEQVPYAIGLPQQLFVRYIDTSSFQLFPRDTTLRDNSSTLEFVNFATASNFADKVDLVQGRMPVPSAQPEAGDAVEVLVSSALAKRLKLQVDGTYTAYVKYKFGEETRPVEIPVRITGTWKAKDPEDKYWFYSTSGYEKTLIVPEEALVKQVLPNINNEISVAVWYWVMDGSKIHASQVPELLNNISNIRNFMPILLPDLRLDITPEEILVNFQKSANSLTIYLYAFSAPLLVMILIFIGLVVDMVVAQRRNEIAVLRSRGASIGQVIGMAVLESLLLSLVGLLIATPASQLIVTFFSKAVSFLNFSAAAQVNAEISLIGMRFGIIAVFVATLAQVFPTTGAAQHTIVTYKQERARQQRRPFWQRMYLDVILLIPAAYGFFIMYSQGGIALPGAQAAVINDPFQNPLLLLVPALAIFALTLILIRFLPYLMSLVAWLAAKTSSVGILMAARYLSRTSGGYNAPLILLTVTLSLATFTASLAQTLDKHIHDQTYYQVGSDMNMVEMGEYAGAKAVPGVVGMVAPPSGEGQNDFWIFLPVDQHLTVPGVKAAARVGRYDINIEAAGQRIGATFLGVDRVDFSNVAYWRSDFAPQPLGALMNDLASDPEAVLVNSQDLANSGLNIGDSFTITGSESGHSFAAEVKIAGTYNLFPTWYPGGAPLLVGNLDYFFEQLGGEVPYNVWLKTDPNANPAAINKGVKDLYQTVMDSDIAANDLSKAMFRPERQGFFGLLSVGFVALGVLTVLGFLLYALFSFRRRFIELGMLRAIGLSTRQMLIFLTSELAFLFLVGLGAGTAMGVAISNLIIPLLQVGNQVAARIPPFLVRIDWLSVFQIYILFGILFVVALVVLFVMLVRMKIFQAVKLGEAV